MKVRGASSVIRGLATFREKGKKVTSHTVQALGFSMTAETKSNAPKNFGKLAQSVVQVSENEGLRSVTEVGVPYGAFVEFGTGMHVEVPAELKQEALKFKGMKSGSFDDFMDSLKAWVKAKNLQPKDPETGRVHVDPDEYDFENMVFMIAMSILKKGIKPQPYLYPAWVKYRAELKPKLAAALNRLVKETNGRS